MDEEKQSDPPESANAPQAITVPEIIVPPPELDVSTSIQIPPEMETGVDSPIQTSTDIQPEVKTAEQDTKAAEGTMQAPTEIKSEVIINPAPGSHQTVTISEQIVPKENGEEEKKGFIKNLLVKAKSAIQFRKAAKLQKIMDKISQKGRISNDEVEKLLRVSNMTAYRYLESLEKQGKVRQVGKTGKSVFYERI
jgi:hypothetical protein